MEVRRSGVTLSASRGLTAAAVLALGAMSATATADVLFQINDPATGAPLADQTIRITAPDGQLSEETTNRDGSVRLPDAEGSGWTASYIVDGRTYTAAGIASSESAEGRGSGVLIGVLAGLGAVGIAASAGSDDSAPSDTVDPGGGIPNVDTSCLATVNVNESLIENPGSIPDVPVDGNVITLGVLGNAILILDIDLPNLIVRGDLNCGTATGTGLENCTGTAVGTFYGSTVTVDFSDSFAVTSPMGPVRQIESATTTIAITGGSNDYSTRFASVCN
jgi:hypothetical protein